MGSGSWLQRCLVVHRESSSETKILKYPHWTKSCAQSVIMAALRDYPDQAVHDFVYHQISPVWLAYRYPSFPAAPRGTKINMNNIHTRHQNCRHWNPKGCRYPGYFLLPKPPFCRSQEAREEHGWPRSCQGHSHHDETSRVAPVTIQKKKWNLIMTQLKRKIIWTKLLCVVGSMLIFPGIYIYIHHSILQKMSFLKVTGPHFGCDKTWQENRRSFGSLGQ